MLPPVTRIMERDLRVFARLWPAFAFSMFLMPVLFLAAMGVGLGGLIDDQRTVEGLSYLHFVAPGLLVAAVVQAAAGESLWAVLGGVKWDGRFIAMVATPLTVTDVYVGIQCWVAERTILTRSRSTTLTTRATASDGMGVRASARTPDLPHPSDLARTGTLMGIEKHELPHPPPAEAGAELARLLDGLTRTVLDLPDDVPVQEAPEVEAVAPVEEPAPVPEPRVERRHGNVLNELSFLDD